MLERELLEDKAMNQTLAPIVEATTSPISLKQFRRLLNHLLILSKRKRDDHIFGATKYFYNTLGVLILNNNTRDTIDQPCWQRIRNYYGEKPLFNAFVILTKYIIKHLGLVPFAKIALSLYLAKSDACYIASWL
jgi:hypothetical protein